MRDIENILEVRPGRVAALRVDRLAAIEPESAAAAIRDALDVARGRNARFVQSLIDPADEQVTKLLQSCGFSQVTEVLYLVSSTVGRGSSQSCKNLRFVPIEDKPAMLSRLSQLVSQAYEGSQDCPQLSGLRPVDEVLASYRAVSASDLRYWSIAEQENADVGCILLAEHSALRELEIVYMGIVPPFRGRALGLELVRHAQDLAEKLSAVQLCLAVDAENRPALAVYRDAGFRIAAKHRLFLLQFEI